MYIVDHYSLKVGTLLQMVIRLLPYSTGGTVITNCKLGFASSYTKIEPIADHYFELCNSNFTNGI